MNRSNIAIYLDDALTQRVREIQQELSQLTGSTACMKSIPHITIGSGCLFEEEQEKEFIEKIENVIQSFKPFSVDIQNYGFNEHSLGGKVFGYSPYVIYLHVTPNTELYQLAEKLKVGVTDHYPNPNPRAWPYTFHITAAYKDLSQEGFEKAKAFLKGKEFRAKLIVDRVSLSKVDKNGNWSEGKRIYFK